MYLKVINFKRSRPLRPADLRRRLRYLFTPDASLSGPDARLLGPPDLHKLVLLAHPWGEGIHAAAEEITKQMVHYCRIACAGRAMPDTWFVHCVVSFAHSASDVLQRPNDAAKQRSWSSQALNAYRVAKDVWSFFGWNRERPSVFVAHGDKEHIHVHLLALIPQIDGGDWSILRTTRSQRREIARISADAFGMDLAGEEVHVHAQEWEQMLDDQPGPRRDRKSNGRSAA